MMDMEKLGAELLSGRQGGAIRDMANSPEAKKYLWNWSYTLGNTWWCQ